MYASKYVFGKGFFVAWIVVAIIWVWITMLVAGFYPIIDGWQQLRNVYRGLKTGTPVIEEPDLDSRTQNSDKGANSSSEG